jgi:hypothetical protein
VRKRLGDLGLEIPSHEHLGPEALRAYQAAEIGKWWQVIRATNM